MSATLSFLEKILPQEDDHWYVAAIFQDNRCRHQWYRDRLRLAAELVEADRKGHTVYHACAAFRHTSGGRKAANVIHAASLWTDIDAGEGKQYATAVDAHNAVVAICNSTGLPRPLCVGSGFGVHLYWPLGTSVDPETWKRYSGGLAQLLRQHGIKHERTTDLASLLRPVGTTNRKHGILPVKLIADADDFEISDLRLLLDVAPNTQKISAPTIVNSHTLAGKLGSITARPRHSASAIKECGQFRYRDARGYVPEPLWHLGLGVLAFIESDGDEAAHQWSSDDDRYNPQQTQERLDRIRASTSGATTCARFHQENPEICEACPHWQKINSPIALCSVRGKVESRSLATAEILELPDLPAGYVWNNNKLCEVRENNNGKQVESVISQHPIYFDSSRARESRAGRSLYYRQFTRADGWHDIVVDAGALRSASGCAEFSSKGANISDWAAFVRYSIAAIDMQYTSDEKKELIYEQFGWKHDDTCFLYGLDLYTPTKIRRVIGDDNVTSRTGVNQIWVGPCQGGSLSGWVEAANTLFAPGTEAQSVAICASFGSVFHRFLCQDEGGSVISLVTHQGGRGKTTALVGGYTVWGQKLGLSIENIDSSISKGATLASIGNLPLFHDQFDATDPVIVRNFIDMFTNGRDKRRMGRNGIISTAGMQWQTTMFTASNASLIDSIESTGNNAVASRILEMSVNIPDHLKQLYLGDSLKNKLRENSGYAGAWFLSKLMAADNLARAKHDIEHWYPIICREGRLGTEHRFWARLATTVAVGAEFARNILLLDPPRIMKWLMDHIKNCVAATNNDDWPIDALASFMVDHSQNQLVVPGPFFPGQADATMLNKPTRELFIRKETSNGRIFICKDELLRWCVKKGYNTRELIEYLFEKKVCLVRRRNITLGAGTNIASTRLNCIEIDGTHPLVSDALATKDDNVLPFTRPDPNRDNRLGGMDEDLPY